MRNAKRRKAMIAAWVRDQCNRFLRLTGKGRMVRFSCYGMLACLGLSLVVRLALPCVPLPAGLFAAPLPAWDFVDRHGQSLRTIRVGDEPFHAQINFGEVPEILVQATLAAEDNRFWQHS